MRTCRRAGMVVRAVRHRTGLLLVMGLLVPTQASHIYWDTIPVVAVDNKGTEIHLPVGTVTNGKKIQDWDTSKVTDMAEVFLAAHKFNEDLSNWQTGQVTTMKDMFNGAKSFNTDISKWQVRHC